MAEKGRALQRKKMKSAFPPAEVCTKDRLSVATIVYRFIKILYSVQIGPMLYSFH